jgi:hypothetical protein
MLNPLLLLRNSVDIMAEAHCEICDMMGYRTCDVEGCEGIVFDPNPSGVDICPECVESSPTY